MFDDPLRWHSFPNENMPDEDIVKALGLPKYLDTLDLKAPQKLAINFGARTPRFILSFDKGMGKTVTYLTAMHEQRPDRLLILCSKNAMLAQRREILRHFPKWAESYGFVQGTKEQRARQWNSGAKVLITTPATMIADMGLRTPGRGQKQSVRIAPKWVDGVPKIDDEFHKQLRTRKSTYYEYMKKAPHEGLILSSGSAAGKGPQDLWPALHICAPKLFRGYWPYVNTFCHVNDGPFGKEILGVKNVDGWRRSVSPLIIHRRKDLKDYPEKTRSSLEVVMEPWQQKIHDELRSELMSFLPSGELLFAQNSMAAFMKIRQFMVCPKFFDRSLGWGAGLEGIWEDAKDSELSHFVVSTPFRGPIEWIERFFQEKGLFVARLTGGEDLGPDEIEARIAQWTKRGGVMIQTIKYAQSYELPAAQNMYMLGYDSDPEANSQAEDRIHRDRRITPHPVNIYYVKHLGSYDERLIDILSTSADNVYNLMHRPLSEVFELDLR